MTNYQITKSIVEPIFELSINWVIKIGVANKQGGLK